MSHKLVIAGAEVELSWTVESARRMRFRAGKIGENPGDLWRALGNPKRADYAAGCLLWLLVPEDIHRKHDTPDDLWVNVADDDIPGVLKAIVGVLADSAPDAEKKSISRNLPLPGSNSD